MIAVISSSGGHLTEAMEAASELGGYDIFYVTSKMPHIEGTLKGKEHYFVRDPHVSLVGYLVNAFQAFGILTRKRPRIIISTGAGIAVPMCFIGKALGAKIIFIETGARVTTPSRTGGMIYKIADLFVIQRESLRKYYPRAVCGGSLV
ncbi:MAG: polysaccharide biosynthesis protein [Candidatus Omnitrophica bacterium]|nr:polysaccharide biosynthesis protein [Candidatus Omnitrophota bacterium]